MSIYMTVFKCICMHEYMYVCMYVLYAYIRVCMHLCEYAYMYICMHACVHTCMYMCWVLSGTGHCPSWEGELSGEVSGGIVQRGNVRALDKGNGI